MGRVRLRLPPQLRLRRELQRQTRCTDAGPATGNLALPLAYLLPQCEVVAVDLKATAIQLLTTRIAEAGLTNIRAVCGDIQQVRFVWLNMRETTSPAGRSIRCGCGAA